MRMNAATAVVTGLCVWAGAAAAQTAATTSKPSAATRGFITKAAQANVAEVELGRLAAERAESAEIKNFAQKMVDDHRKANQELEELATKKGVTLPTYVDAAHKAAKARLEKLSGAAFDRSYAGQMVRDHQAAVALFRTQARTGRDEEVKAWAAKMLPDLESHLKMARDLSRQENRASR